MSMKLLYLSLPMKNKSPELSRCLYVAILLIFNISIPAFGNLL